MWWLFGIKGYDRSAGAIAAFGVLGDDARPALDDLRRIAGRYDGSGTFASLAIREMGYGSRDVDPSRIQF
jgi:hypothetical protein